MMRKKQDPRIQDLEEQLAQKQAETDAEQLAAVEAQDPSARLGAAQGERGAPAGRHPGPGPFDKLRATLREPQGERGSGPFESLRANGGSGPFESLPPEAGGQGERGER